MTETNQANAIAGPSSGGGRRHHRWLWLGGTALVALGVLAVLAPRASAYRVLRAHGFAAGRPAFSLRMGHDPAAAKRHAGMAVEWALRGVRASEEQRQQGHRIADRVVDELVPLVEQHRTNTHAIALELAKPEIDKAAIDRLRQQQLALADKASRALVDGFTELAESLTPEQRKELVEFAQRLHHGEGPLE